MLRHYVEFVYPGIIVSESSSREIESREAPVEMPAGAFGYRFFDRVEQDAGEETLYGKPKNRSAWHYQGEIWTVDRVKAELPNERILISNMRGNGYDRVVKTRSGQFIPLEPEDQVQP